MKIINTPLAEINFNHHDNILHIKILEGAAMNLKNAELHYKQINDLVGDKKYLALVDASDYFTMEKEAWQYASSKEVVSNRLAVAHYNSSFANKLATKFFKTSYQTSMPLEIFTTKEEAIKWLKSISVPSDND